MPENHNKPVAIVLGGTNPHIELIHQLQDRGYFVVLADYLPDPPARTAADIHEQISTLDQDVVLETAKKHNASLVISACVDQANITACYVAEQLGLTKPYSYKTASEITNKGVMKSVMAQHQIPTTRYIYLDAGEEPADFDLRFPVMVKPADSNAASGVKKAENPEQMAQYLAEAKKVSRTGRTIVEEFFSGVEISAYCFVESGTAKLIMASERVSVIEGEDRVLKCYATVTPPAVSDAAMEKVEQAATAIAKAFELDNTPLHVQALINGDEISIIEFAPRVGGGISYETIRDNTGFDIIAATIDSYLERPVKVAFQPVRGCCSVNIIYGVPSVFDHVDGVDALLESGAIDSFHYHKTPGTQLTAKSASRGRIAAFVVRAESRPALCEKVASAMQRLDAFDAEGNSILRKDLYLKQ